MCIRERKRRQEGEGLPAIGAAATPDSNPVVMFIVRLLAAVTMSDDRITFTNGTPPQDDLGGVCGPASFELVLRGGKWDKKNRSSIGARPGIDLPKI